MIPIKKKYSNKKEISNSLSPNFTSNLTPSLETKNFLEQCYGVSWTQNENSNEKRDSFSSYNMTPPSLNTAKIINSLIGKKVYRQSISENK